MTFSLSCLFNLNFTFQVRNKPIEPPKKPEKAPFFLPSVPSLSGEVLFEPGKVSEKENDGIGDGKQMNKSRLDMPPSRFLHLLQSSKETDSCKNPTISFLFASCIVYCSQLLEFIHCLPLISHIADAAFTDYIKGLSPSNLDMELRMFQIIDDNDQQEAEKRRELVWIEQLLDYFIYELSCRNNFEFLQAVIRLFLKVWDISRCWPVQLFVEFK